MYIFFLLLSSLIFGNTVDNSNKEKCQLEFMKGTWYGEFTYYSGTTFHLSMNVQEVDKCKIRGELHWPDYFNTRSTFEGKLENGELKFVETNITEGVAWDISQSSYSITVEPSDTLEGVAYVNGEDMATFRIYRKDELGSAKIQYYEQVLRKRDSIYGKTIIEGPAAITLDELRKLHKEKSKDEFLPFGLKVEGRGFFSQVSLPLTIYYKPPMNFYMEMRFQNLKFIAAKNDSISWSYDPTKDELTVNDLDEGDDDSFNHFSSNFIKDTDGNIHKIKINNATVAGVPTYRIAYYRDENPEAYYLSKDGYRVIRNEANNAVNEYLDYMEVGQTWVPGKFLQMAPGGTVNAFYFDDVQKADDIQDHLFSIPEALKSKQTESGPTAAELGDKAFEEEDYQRAEDLYSKAIDNYPYDAVLYYSRGVTRYELKDNYGAISDLERAIDLDDKVGKYYNYLGLVKYRFGDYEKAKADFQKAIELDETLQIAYMNTAFASYQLEEYDTALVFLDRGITLDSTNGQFYLNRGIILSETERYQEAIADYEKAIHFGYGNQSEIENRIGVAYYRQEKFDKAQEYFEKALAANPDNYQMQKNLANALYYGGQYKPSTVQYHKALKMKSDDDDLLNSLAMSYYHEEDYDAAIHYLNMAIDLNDQNANYFDNRAYSYAGMMRYQEAIDDFTTSIELYSKDMEVYYQRGLLLKIQNNRFDACRDFQKAVEMGHEQAAEEIKELCAIDIESRKSKVKSN